jgi:Domain of unknown function (DUF4159)
MAATEYGPDQIRWRQALLYRVQRGRTCEHLPPARAAAVYIVVAVPPSHPGTSAVCAQQLWVGDGWWGRMRPKWATASDFDGTFQFCRVFYTSGRNLPSNSGWHTDYPGADINFSIRLSELTRVRVRFDENRQPNHVVVSLTDPLLFRCPILFMTPLRVSGHWRRSGGETSELGDDSEHVAVRGIADSRGRLMVLMTHNTDISDSWEREGQNPEYFNLFSPMGYAIGINVALYAMRH